VSRRLALLAIALLSLGAVGAAYYTQHVWGMQPCPWCVLQRAIFVLVAALALLAALLPGMLQTLGLAWVVAAADAGIAAAVWQHFVAAEAESCTLTLADRIMSALGLDALWPEVFMATATCAEAKVKLWGLPYEFWSGALFTLISAAATLLLVAGLRRRPLARVQGRRR
jgi:disulfide bond formation protein DsbB